MKSPGSYSVKKRILRWSFLLYLIFVFTTSTDDLVAQTLQDFPEYYDKAEWEPKLDSLRTAIGGKVKYKNRKNLELATLLALSHYPMLQDRKVKIIVKDQRGAPVEASFSVWNFILPRRSKVYKIVIQEGSFMERLPLNQQVSALGHEMAHFVQYDERRYFGTLFSLLGWVLSDKSRIKFEKDADKIAIDHGLGPQLLDFAFYTGDAEIRQYMKEKGYDH